MLTVKEMLSLNKSILSKHFLPLYVTDRGHPSHYSGGKFRDLIEIECGSLGVIYDDPKTFEMYTDFWADSNMARWWELAHTFEYKYNAINNYDRTEVLSDTEETLETGASENTAKHTGVETGRNGESIIRKDISSNTTTESGTTSETSTATGNGNSKITGTAENSVTKNSTHENNTTNSVEETENETGSSENSVAGFNSTTLEVREGTNSTRNAEKGVETVGVDSGTIEEMENGNSTTESNETHSTSATGEKNGSNERESAENSSVSSTTSGEKTVDNSVENNEENSGNYNKSVKRTNTHTAQISGNIGVTTTQEMIEQERKVWMFNLYKLIAEEFKQNFCVMVYY